MDATFDASHMQTFVSVEVRNASRSPEVHDTSDEVRRGPRGAHANML